MDPCFCGVYWLHGALEALAVRRRDGMSVSRGGRVIGTGQ